MMELHFNYRISKEHNAIYDNKNSQKNKTKEKKTKWL
jgi:hypothetical protein